MKEVTYKDPFECVPVVIQIEEDDVEGLDEIVRFLNEDARLKQNMERRERYRTLYHLDALVYEGEDYAADVDVEEEVLRKDMEDVIDEWVHKNLTWAHYRRFNLYMDKVPIREIARLEEVNYSTVNESIKATQKKLKKLYGTPSKIPF